MVERQSRSAQVLRDGALNRPGARPNVTACSRFTTVPTSAEVQGLGPWRGLGQRPNLLCLSGKWVGRRTITQPPHQSREAGSCLGRFQSYSGAVVNGLESGHWVSNPSHEATPRYRHRVVAPGALYRADRRVTGSVACGESPRSVPPAPHPYSAKSASIRTASDARTRNRR